MTERPILFSGPMVRAILEGRKTQTRRPVKDPPKSPGHYMQRMWGTSPPPDPVDFGEPGMWCIVGPDYPDDDSDLRRCPFGAEGDRLWVREGWRPAVINANIRGARMFGVQYRAGFAFRDDVPGQRSPLFDDWQRWELSSTGNRYGRWRPSIHMPRWASRITLEVTDVRAQRLQEITTEDIIAEGIAPTTERLWADPEDPEAQQAALDHANRVAFIEAWDKLNGKRAPWSSNPWVRCVSFRMLN